MFELEQAMSISGGTPPTLKLALFALIAALLLAQVIAFAYMWTYRGMSYTRSYVHAIPIGSVIACMLMLAANNNLAAGIGIAGSLSVLRLRIAMRDPKDLVFIFAGVAVGVACGVHAFTVAFAGTVVFIGTAIVLALLEAGQRNVFEGMLRFYGPTDVTTEAAVTSILKRYAGRFALLTLREVRQGDAMEYAYHLRLKNTDERIAMVRELEAVTGVDGVTLYYQDATQEL
jgi:Domain of unknown function (DUF4956)